MYIHYENKYSHIYFLIFLKTNILDYLSVFEPFELQANELCVYVM